MKIISSSERHDTKLDNSNNSIGITLIPDFLDRQGQEKTLLPPNCNWRAGDF